MRADEVRVADPQMDDGPRAWGPREITARPPAARGDTMATIMTTKTQGMAYQAARARWATVRVETEGGIYVGRMYVPETKKRVSDVLSDDRQFISLTEVSVNDSAHTESFVAVNKLYIRTIRILHEGLPEDGRPALRRIEPS